MDGGAWWAAVHGVTESWTRLRDFTFTFHFHALEKEMATAFGQLFALGLYACKDKSPNFNEILLLTYIYKFNTAAAATAAKLLQSCPTLCDPIDRSPPGSPSLGFSRQEYWSGLPFPSPMHESEK